LNFNWFIYCYVQLLTIVQLWAYLPYWFATNYIIFKLPNFSQNIFLREKKSDENEDFFEIFSK